MDEGGKFGWVVPIIMIIAIGIVVFFVVNGIFFSWEIRYTVVDSEIIDIDTITDEGRLDYLVVNFTNGESYKIEVYKDIDLTVNSKIVLELSNSYTRTWFWEDFEPVDDIYSISKIIKIPSKEE